ncbi:hypothetical protein EMIT0P12_110089 [Pseudomonas sp. IT-P12]
MNVSVSPSSRAGPLPHSMCVASNRRVIEHLAALLLDQCLLDGGLVHLIGMFLAGFRQDAQTRKQSHVLVGLRVGGGQQFFAIEDRVGAGEERQGLHLLVHGFAAGGQAYVGFGHQDARNGEHADEVERVDVFGVFQRCAGHFHQHVDRHRLRMLRQVGQLDQQVGAVVEGLAHAEDTAGTDLHPRIPHIGQSLQALAVGAGGDDAAVELRRGIKVVVVVVEAGLGQRLGLLLIEAAEGHAGFQAQGLHPFDHFQHVGHVFGRRVFPGGAHAEPGRTDGLGAGGLFEDLLHFHQLFFFQAGVVVTGLRTVFAVFRAGAGLDREQRGHLHTVGVEVRAVHGLRLEQQVIEWLNEESFDFGQRPVMTQGGRGAGAHGRYLYFKQVKVLCWTDDWGRE